MNQLQLLVQGRLDELNKQIKETEEFLKHGMEGSLRITHNKHTVQYYHRTKDGTHHGTYIHKREWEKICGLAQKDYELKLHRKLLEEKRVLEEFTREYHPEDYQKLYQELSQERQNLVRPYELPTDVFVKQWESERYPVMFQPKEDHGIYTEKGEPVRSKSEKIIADKLYAIGVPYHYEKPLYLDGYGEIHPDFTVLNRRTRKEYYWEHMGMMGDSSYCDKAIKKIETYQKNGIYPGENLILTFETTGYSMNTRNVTKLIDRYL